MRGAFCALGAVFFCACRIGYEPVIQSETDAGQNADCSLAVESPAECAEEPCSLALQTIRSSSSHTCGLDTDGTIWCWGSNCGGQLGQGDTYARTAPVRVPLPARAVDLGVGLEFTCALTEDDEVYCWGKNVRGSLGLGDAQARLAPSAPTMSGEEVRSLAVGGHSACALLEAHARCWGSNAEGQLGFADSFLDGEGVDRLVPEDVMSPSGQGWQQLALAQGHGCGIDVTGALYCTGRNTHLQLGLGPLASEQLREFTRVGDASDWTAVELGDFQSCAIRQAGRLFCWGRNTDGEIGQLESTSFDTPQPVEPAEVWTDIALDALHGCGITEARGLLCFGRSIEGQLGFRDDGPVFGARPVLSPSGVVDVEVGRFSSFARTSSGVYASGMSNLGTGVPEGERHHEFTEVLRP